MSIKIQSQALQNHSEAHRNPRQIQTRNFGRWTSEEQLKYVAFLEFFRHEFKANQKRKFFKIFKMMGEFITTRDGIQCRSHHMKQLKCFKKISSIVHKFKKNMTNHTQAVYDLYLSQISDQYSENMPNFSQRNAEQQQKNHEDDDSVSIQPNRQLLNSQNRVQTQNYVILPKYFPIYSQDFQIYLTPSVQVWQQIMGGLPYIAYNR